MKKLIILLVGLLAGSSFIAYGQSGGLTIPQGGTGRTAFPTGGLLVGDTTLRLNATSSPTVGWITATSTTATSTFSGLFDISRNLVVGGFSSASYFNATSSIATSTFAGGVTTPNLEVNGTTLNYNTASLGSELLTNGNFTAVGTYAATIDATADTVRRTDFQNTKINNNDQVHFSGTLPAAINNSTLYYAINATSGNFKVSLTQGGAAIDFLTAGSSVLFAADWQVTNDAVWDLTNGHIDFAYSTGLASTLKQYLRFRALSSWSNWYSFTYTITNSAGTPTATITTDFALTETALDTTNGTHTTLIRSNTAPGDFTISSTLTAGQAFTIDGVSLKPATGVIASASKMGVGVLDPLYPMDIAGALNLRRDGTPDLSATTVVTDSFTLETDVDALNPSSSALYIYPTENYQGRVYFGKSGKAISRINFSNVTTGFEAYPYFFFNNGATADSFYSNGVRKVFIMAVQSTADIALMTGLDQTYANAGFLTGGQNDAHVGTQIRWKSYAADADTKSPTATYSYDTASANSTIPHTLWQRNGGTLATLSALGNFGIGTTTPWARLSVSATSTSALSNIPLFAVSTSTASATSTVFAIDKNGVVTDKENLYSQQFAYETEFGNASTTASLANTYYPIRGWATTTPTGMPLNTGSSYFTIDAYNGSTTVAVGGVYRVGFSVSASADKVSKIHSDVFVNGVEQKQCAFKIKIANISDSSSGSASCLVNIPANGYIDVYAKSDTASTVITWSHLNRNIEKVSNY